MEWRQAGEHMPTMPFLGAYKMAVNISEQLLGIYARDQTMVDVYRLRQSSGA